MPEIVFEATMRELGQQLEVYLSHWKSFGFTMLWQGSVLLLFLSTSVVGVVYKYTRKMLFREVLPMCCS